MAPPSKKNPSQKPNKPPALKQLHKPFKPKTKPDAAASKSKAAAMQLVEDDVPDFPRGIPISTILHIVFRV